MNPTADDETKDEGALEDLPNSVWGVICRHLSPRDLLSFSAVRRSWRAIASDDGIWKDMYAEHFFAHGGMRASSVLGLSGGPLRVQPPAVSVESAAPWKAAFRVGSLSRRNWRRGLHGSRHLRGHNGPVRSFKFEESLLVSADIYPGPDGRDQNLRVWDLDTGTCKAALSGHLGRITAVDLSGGVAATSAADGTVRLWDAAGAFATQRPLAAPRGAGEDEEQGAWDVPPGVEGEAPSEQHAALATSGDAGRRDEARDAFEIACVRASPGEVEAACCLSLDAAAGRVAASTPAGRVVIYDFAQCCAGRGGGGEGLESHPTETVLSAGSDPGAAREQTCVLMTDGLCAASLPESRVGLWRVPNGDNVPLSGLSGATWDTGQLRVNTLSFDAGGLGGPARVISGGQDGTLRVYDARSALAGGRGDGAAAEPLLTLQEHKAHVLCHQQGGPGSPDLVASGSDDRTVRIWDLRQPPQWACVQLLQHQASVSCLQLSDWVLASGAGNGFISLWDVRAGGVRLATLHGHRGAVWALQFDSRRLVGSAVDDSLIVRSFEPDGPRFARWRGCALCGRAGRRLFACSLCSLQAYCSDECESSDWPVHRVHCPDKPHELIRLQ